MRSTVWPRAHYRRTTSFLAVVLLAAGSASLAQSNLDSQPLLAEADSGLRPGDFRQLRDFQPSLPVTVVVDIAHQLARVYQSKTLVAVTTVSTGKPGHETPAGTFHILAKAVDHRSNLYDGELMPYMQRLTADGIAIHAGEVPGTPASHGCVRMPLGMAKLLYSATRVGTTVTIIPDGAPPDVAQAASTEPPALPYNLTPEIDGETTLDTSSSLTRH